jgi:hypothetical protein
MKPASNSTKTSALLERIEIVSECRNRGHVLTKYENENYQLSH